MKKLILSFVLVVLFIFANAQKDNYSNYLDIPDIPGFLSLKCDLHMHTVFSDGLVWPNVRVKEARREGLDAISITDHIEYSPHKEYVKGDKNTSYNIALKYADKMDVLLIKGSEITRKMPPGHFNTLFLDDSNLLVTEDVSDAIEAAYKQGAFIFWNHPCWKAQQPDTVVWFNEHSKILANGWMHGIEVVNTNDYCPEAHKWCLEKNLTMLSNSDVHNPIDMNYYNSKEDYRPITIVFAKERSIDAIKEALFAGQTMVCFKDTLIALKKFLKPVFEESIIITNNTLSSKKDEVRHLKIKNNSGINYKLRLKEKIEGIEVPEYITLYAHQIVQLNVKYTSVDNTNKRIKIPYIVENMLVAPNKGLEVAVELILSE